MDSILLGLIDFSSEIPDDNPYKIAGGEAKWAIDGDTSTLWANNFENGVWTPFPHWIEIELDSVYDLAALRIVHVENIVSYVPDSVALYIDNGSGQWTDTIMGTFNFYETFDLIFPRKTNLSTTS